MEENKEKLYPKYRNYSLYVFIVVFVLAYFIGKTIFTDGSQYFYYDAWIYALISVIGGFILSTVFYEIGKIVFGKIAGYKLIKTVILFIKFQRNSEDKLKFSLCFPENFGGNTLMVKKNDDFNKKSATLYHLGGTLFSVIVFILGIIFVPMIAKAIGDESISYYYYLMCGIDLLVIIVNTAPFLSDIFNDGFSLRLCLFSEENMKAYHQNLKQYEALLCANNELKLYEYEDYHNLLTIKGLIYNYYYYVDKDDFENAERMLDICLEHKEYILNDDLAKVHSFKIYFMLLKGEIEKVEKDYWELPKSMRKEVNNYHEFECLKTCLLIAAFIDLNYDLYEYITTRLDKNVDKYYALRQEKENDLIDKALEYIQKNKKDWFKEDNKEPEEQ